MITVDANLFRLVYGAVSKEETRYYLNGVHIEPHYHTGAFLVATDGRRMYVAHDEKAQCDETAIVRLPQYVRAQCKPSRMVSTRRVIEVDTSDKGSVTLKEITPPKDKEKGEPKVESLITAYGVVIDGAFPDWERVIPLAPESLTSAFPAFNSALLKEMGAFGADVAKTILGAGHAMRVQCYDNNGPTIFQWQNAPVFGVLMPMTHTIAGHLPAFMNKPEGKKEAA